ncbi:MAG TPA: GrpB family protein [Firmicutes bacterium]|nr:GrpB family protein [Candidatus Fermentithermobacillaceae bacterium]
MLGLKRGIVELHEHDYRWKDNAMETIYELREVFDGVATYIQHVGSTSVAHIRAKPIIDIAVAVDCFDEVMELIPQLEQAGFIHRPQNDQHWQVFFSCGDEKADTRTHHIHVVRVNSTQWRDYIVFRDYLNANPDVAREYEAVKIRLMNEHRYDRLSYTEGKSEFIMDILREAHVNIAYF